MHVQKGNLRLQKEQRLTSKPMGASTGTGSNAAHGGVITFSTSMRQIYISTWSLLCLICMVVVVATFAMQRFGTEARARGFGPTFVSSSSSQHGRLPSSFRSSTSMTKGTAMILVFLYAACAWTMSNGLVLNPRWNACARAQV